MTTPEILQYTKQNPPDEMAFRRIAKSLVARLSARIGLTLVPWNYHIELKNWITVDVRTVPEFGANLHFCYDGIVSYSLRDAKPRISSVMLLFQNGKRITNEGNTILCSEFLEGAWQDLSWNSDTYDEWECDDLPDFQINKQP